MKRIYLFFLILLPFIPGTIKAQTATATLTGSVIDATNRKPVGYATVKLIIQNTGKIMLSALTDSVGKFRFQQLAAGNYQIKVTFVSYADKTLSNIKVADGGMVNLGSIPVAPDTKNLAEVNITAHRALIEEKIDRTVYNAENDLTAPGGDATDVIKRVPMVSVDLDGNVSIRGSQNIKVLINGKTSAMMSASISDALKQIPGDLIKSVEVITSPPAKYDAEGSGGIINIILKKNTLEGLSLNVNSTAGTRGSGLGPQWRVQGGQI